jgi:hypothetical protein
MSYMLHSPFRGVSKYMAAGLISFCSYASFAQSSFSFTNRSPQKPYVETIKKAETEGITIRHLDSFYRSAVHVDTTKAVFKTEKESDNLTNAYNKFLADFGTYLKENHLKWDQPSRCWNRIYFKADGTVDYYLFEFKTAIKEDQLNRFKDLFRSYASSHKLAVTATVSFAHCSSVVFMDK